MDSSAKQIKTLVEKEFENYIPVPSIAEASDFEMLNLCHPEGDSECESSTWQLRWRSQDKKPNDDHLKFTRFKSLGPICDYCPSITEENENLLNQIKPEETIARYNSTMVPQSSTDFQAGLNVQATANVEYHSNVDRLSELDLGIIKRKQIPYHAINKFLKKIPDDECNSALYEEAKDSLYIIYEVLTAEKLESQIDDNSSRGGEASGSTGDSSSLGIIHGSLSVKRKHKERLTLSRPTEINAKRFPFAYKVGPILLGPEKIKTKSSKLSSRTLYLPKQSKFKIYPKRTKRN